MSTPAVTTDSAPAREPSSHFLPDSKEYRMTGKMPKDLEVAGTQAFLETEGVPKEEPKPEPETPETPEVTEPPAETEGDSAPPESETAAGSEPAKPAGKKTPETSESRWAKLSRENRDLRDRLARLEGRDEALRETKPASQPAAPPQPNAEPKIDDVDASGNPKYKTLAEYLAAARKWDREQVLHETEERLTKAQREQQQRQFDQAIERTTKERAEAAKKAYPDFKESMEGLLDTKDDLGRDAFYYEQGTHIHAFFLDCDRSMDVQYVIAKNPEHLKIFARDEQGRYLMNPVRQLRELTRIEASLPAKGNGATPPAKTPTKAPPPPHQTSGKGQVARDAATEAAEKGDYETYAREMNARELAKRKKG